MFDIVFTVILPELAILLLNLIHRFGSIKSGSITSAIVAKCYSGIRQTSGIRDPSYAIIGRNLIVLSVRISLLDVSLKATRDP